MSIDPKRVNEAHAVVEAVAPIHGVSSDGRIDFKDEATDTQRAAAKEALAAWAAQGAQ